MFNQCFNEATATGKCSNLRDDVTDYIRTKEFKPDTMLAMRQLANGIGTEMAIKQLSAVPHDRVGNFRSDMYLMSEGIRLMQKSKTPK
jgi:PiT family inorganic phosphate transporter